MQRLLFCFFRESLPCQSRSSHRQDNENRGAKIGWLGTGACLNSDVEIRCRIDLNALDEVESSSSGWERDLKAAARLSGILVLCYKSVGKIQ